MNDNLRKALEHVLARNTNIRWKFYGPGTAICSWYGCGARAWEDPDTGDLRRRDPCSESCPWGRLEAAIHEEDAKTT